MHFDAPRGIWPVLYAFFAADGRLDRAAMRAQVQACVVGGASGLVVLGLATEVGKLNDEERRHLVAWAAEDLAGRLPLAVTVAGEDAASQTEAAAFAAREGAAFVMLQPPRDPAFREPGMLAQFFGTVMAQVPLPVGLQNAPEYLGLGLQDSEIAALARTADNFRVLKGEGPAVAIERVVSATGGRLAVMNGRGGLELPDNFRAGCAGLIPAPDCFDVQVRAWAAMARGEPDTGERLYREVLPAIVFAMQSLDHLICYGKRIVAARLGLGEVFDRAPAVTPTPFGLAAAARFAEALGRYAEQPHGA